MKKTKPANEVDQYRFRLSEEIRFWQHMIEQCCSNDQRSELPRMLEAMALAEYRLLQLNGPDNKERPN